jgi:hypothetical protein
VLRTTPSGGSRGTVHRRYGLRVCGWAMLIGWLSTLPTGHAPTSPHHGLRQRLMMGAWLSAWMARPLLVARSIGSPHHSSDASYGGTADTGVVVLETDLLVGRRGQA